MDGRPSQSVNAGGEMHTQGACLATKPVTLVMWNPLMRAEIT